METYKIKTIKNNSNSAPKIYIDDVKLDDVLVFQIERHEFPHYFRIRLEFEALECCVENNDEEENVDIENKNNIFSRFDLIDI